MAGLRIVLAFFLALLAAPANAAPLSAFGRLPTIEDASISPSGHAVALVVTDGEKRTLVVRDLATGSVTLRGLLGTKKIRNVQWAGDRHMVLVASTTTRDFLIQNGFREWYFANIIDIEKKKIRSVMATSKADLDAIYGMPTVRVYQGKPAVFVKGFVFVGNAARLTLFRVDLDSGVNRVVESGSEDTIGWTLDASGAPVAEEFYARGSKTWSMRVREGAGWREAASAVAPLDRPYMIGLGRDNASILYAQKGQNDRWDWRETRTDGRPPADPVPAMDLQGSLRAALDGTLVGQYTLTGDDDSYTFFDPSDQAAWKSIVDAFPGDRVQLQSWSSNRRLVVVLVDSRTRGPAFVLVNLLTRKAEYLGAQFGDLKPEDISPQQPVRYKAADGLELSGYLTTPRGQQPKDLPLIVFPHGGPAVRDMSGFDWWAQAMASRGYAVLQVNFRGSSGLGVKFLEAGYGQWGRKMQTDLSDGVRYLAGRGLIDPKRVCIVGGSYGGYAALAGATLDTGVYRCAVSVAGLSDLRRFVAGARIDSDEFALRYWNRFMGADDLKDPSLVEISPVTHVDRVTIPVLMIHGKDDTVVPLEQSRIMATALEKAGKPFELIVQNGADHWLSRGDTRLQTLTATMAFVEKHNPPN
jgi:dipeptidyl aminopeptidase/acylaminoacyl peptidase